jgi:hypothetical protein
MRRKLKDWLTVRCPGEYTVAVVVPMRRELKDVWLGHANGPCAF